MKDAPVWLVLLTLLAVLFVGGVVCAFSIHYPGFPAFLILLWLVLYHDGGKERRK